MYASGQQQLQSATWLQQFSSDRPSFHALVCHTLLPNRPYLVFVMPQGLLFIETKYRPGMPGNRNNNAIVMGAVLGGAIGACIGAAIANANSYSESQAENLDMYSEEQLYELAAQRKRSFVARMDEIQSVSIDVPGTWGRLFANSSLAGWITLRDRKLGKIAMENHDQADLSVAVDALPRRFGDRVFVNCALDRNSARFIQRTR
jgi:hypothetical protein